MSKRSTTTETAHLAPLRSTAQVSAPAKDANGRFRTQKGNRGSSLAERHEYSSLSTVSKTLVVFLLCIQLDYSFNAAAGITLLSYKREQISLRNVPPRGSRYDTGPWDALFVAFYTALILLVRKIITQKPRAVASVFGAKSPERFAEQLFSFVYFSVSTTFGLFIALSRHTWSMNARDLISELETGSLNGNVKCFYLIQAAFWVQEALVVGLQLEKPREDYLQLIFHHVITLVAIGLSYGGKYTDLGIMILVTHDASDAVLGLSVLSICCGWTVSSHPDGLQELARVSVLAIDGSVGLLEFVRLWSPDPACATWLSLSYELVVIQRTSMTVGLLTYSTIPAIDSKLQVFCLRGVINLVTVGGGMLMKDILSALHDRNLTAVSGASPDVAIGGYLTGGGHSVLSATQGLAADNVIQLEIVTPQGDIVTANECQNSDLFWAVRGGGGGTFGVITKATIRTFPSPRIGSMALAIPLPTNDLLWEATTKVFQVTPVLANVGISGYIYAFPEDSPFFQGGPALLLSLVGVDQSASQVLDILRKTDVGAEFEELLNYTNAYPVLKDYDSHFAWWLDNVDKTPVGTNFMGASRLLNMEAVGQPFEQLKQALKTAAGSSGFNGILGAGPGVWNASPRGGGNAFLESYGCLHKRLRNKKFLLSWNNGHKHCESLHLIQAVM
ncbi:FAD-linked oxidoreductase YvdP [Diaporthe amygdali]|uniref:FAD-linked oxidoreductase YvdP n=1 Tax=Phomopsis amygdali TaxID=1214568 RepID=UPI0022FF18F8|nr:FAD-linked oxidoreductase YvdP [Diaporthe amygdali]KAJ0124303.1 FAD-linked oxidoreductase YvdP [Diaporthe amygdali]